MPVLASRRLQVPVLVVDVTLAVVVSVVVVVAIRVATEPGQQPPVRPPDLLAYGLGTLTGALLLGRRRWPLGVLFATAAVLLGYYSLHYAGIAPALPLAAALYSAAEAGRLRWSLLVGAAFITAGIIVRGFRAQLPLLPLLTSFAPEASLMVAVALLGETVRNRRLRMVEAGERLRRADAEREQEAARRVAEERLRLARELHDVAAHAMTTIRVQAEVAVDSWDDDPPQVRAALGTIRAASHAALTELGATVGLLRGADDGPRPPAPGLGQLEGLLELARSNGMQVNAVVTGEPTPVPPAVDLTAYRVIQEALTNVVRHAKADLVTVTVHRGPALVVVEITDNGRACEDTPAVGHGLVGMRERVSALGGRLDAGPAPHQGFRVHAELPIEEPSA